MSEMSDRKPYLLRAIYQWILDNHCTPHLVIAAPGAGWVQGVPAHLLKDEILVLNISPQATENCIIDNDSVTFNTRFGGRVHSVWIGMEAVISLVARENGEGITLPPADNIEDGPPKKTQEVVELEKAPRQGRKSSAKIPNHFKIIK